MSTPNWNPHLHGQGDACVDRVMADPALRAIVAAAGLNVYDLTANQRRIWRALDNGARPMTRVQYAAVTVDHLASRVRFHIAYDNDEEYRLTFSLLGCLVMAEAGEVGLDAARSLQALIDEVIVDFRWAVANLRPLH